MVDQQRKLEELLLEHGLLKPSQLAYIERRATDLKRKPLDIIREEKLVQPEALARLQAELAKLPYVDISEVTPDGAILRDVSMRAAATYRFIPFAERDGALHVAMADPNDVQALEAVRFIAKKRGMTPRIFLASGEGVDETLATVAKEVPDAATVLRDFDQQLKKHSLRTVQIKPVHLPDEAPVTKTAAVIIRHAIEGSATDMHIEPTERELRVRFRLGGRLYTSIILPSGAHAALVARLKLLANLHINETKLPQYGRFSLRLDRQTYTLQVSTMPTLLGEKVVIRIVAAAQRLPSLEELGLWGQQQRDLNQYLRVGSGLALVSGPDSVGKTTTLFAALATLDVNQLNIATLEEHIELELPGITQTQIHPEQGLSYTVGLNQLLRQDTDIILVDQLADPKVAQLMLHAAATSRRLLSSTNAEDALSNIVHLAALGLPPYLIAAGTRLVISQRLVPKLCQACKQEAAIPPHLRQELVAALKGTPRSYFTERSMSTVRSLFISPGCPVCHESGYAGHIGIFEVVPVTRQLQTAILDGQAYEQLVSHARGAGCISMRQEGILKALQGIVRYEDVARVTATVAIH